MARGAAAKRALVGAEAWDPFPSAAWRLGCQTASLGELRGAGPAVVVLGDVGILQETWRRAGELAAAGFAAVGVTDSEVVSVNVVRALGGATTVTRLDPRARAEELRASEGLSIPCLGVPYASMPPQIRSGADVGLLVLVDAGGRVAFVQSLGARERLLAAAVARVTAR